MISVHPVQPFSLSSPHKGKQCVQERRVCTVYIRKWVDGLDGRDGPNRPASATLPRSFTSPGC